MTPDTLKAWRARLTLSEHAMAAYLGVPLGTLRKWENGQRQPDSAPLRLFAVLQRIEDDAPFLWRSMVDEARNAAPDPKIKPVDARKGRGRGKGATVAENVSAVHSAPPPWVHAADALPAWMIQGGAPCP